MREAEERVAFFHELGVAITTWARLEYTLYAVTSWCFVKRAKATFPDFHGAYFSTENFRAKLQFSDAIISGVVEGTPHARDWAALVAQLATRAKARNRLAHNPASFFPKNPDGRRVALLPNVRSPNSGERKPKYPPGALFVRDIARVQREFLATMWTLENFSSRVLGDAEFWPKADEQPLDPPTIHQLVSRIREALVPPRPPSRPKS
jgi:hypothetical protein